MSQKLSSAFRLTFTFLGLTFLALLLGYHAFVNIKCLSYPWWEELNNDADGNYVAQTLALINDGSLHYVHHPGGTVYTLHSLVYRSLMPLDKKFALLGQLPKVPNIQVAFALLNIAMHTSRVITFILYLSFVAVFFLLLYQLTRHLLISFFFTFFYCASRAAVHHLFIIRPELLNMLFCGLAFSLILSLNSDTAPRLFSRVGKNIFIGVSLGFALLAKIQAAPLVIALLGTQWYLEFHPRLSESSAKKVRMANIVFPFVNLVIFPWWAVQRPAFLTDSYLLNSGPDYIRTYRYAPDSFALAFLAIFVGLCLAGVLFQTIKQLSLNRAANVLFALNTTIFGLILSAYLAFVPASVTFKGYAANTHHLIYAFLTNITGGGFLIHKVSDWDTPRNIMIMHDTFSSFLGKNVLLFVLLAALSCGWRLAVRGVVDKKPYAAVLIFFLLGFTMDAFSSMRMLTNKIFDYYALYSLGCHCLGLGLWVGCEWKNAVWGKGIFNFRTAFILLMAAHLVMRTGEFLRTPKATGIYEQTPEQEYLNTKSHASPFWDIVEHRNK